MLSNSSIQNQNVINSNNISGSSSGSVVCSSLTLTDGTTTNTLTHEDWTGTIKTVNTTANATHFLNFSDSSSTGQGNSQKSSNLSCNPSTGSITATTFVGSLTGNASSATNAQNMFITNDNTGNTFFPTFTNGNGNKSLYIDITTGPLTYVPNTGTLTASNFNGLASSSTTSVGVNLTSDDTSGSYFVPFSKTATATGNSLFIDNTTTALTYDPSTSTLNCTNLTGTIKTVNTAVDATHFLNFSDSSSTGQGNPQKNSNLSCNPLLSKITATTFEGIATISDSINLSSDDTSGTYFLPFSKTINTTSGNKLFIDNVTGPLSYDPSTSILTASVFSGSATTSAITDTNDATTYYPVFVSASGNAQTLRADITSNPLSYIPSTGVLATSSLTSNTLNAFTSSATCNIFNILTTGSVNIMGSQTTGSINIGATSATTGLLNIRPPIVLARQIQTTNSTTYPPNAVNHLGFTTQTLGSSFTTTSIPANTNTNLFSYSFTSANYGTYSFSAIVALSPNDNTASRQLILAISQSSATVVFTPFLDMKYSTANVGHPYLNVQGVIQIYSGSPTIYLVAYCLGSAASVQTSNSTSHFSYTRIA